MGNSIVIEKLHFDEVVVNCHDGVINSKNLNKPLHKLPFNGQPGWSVQFDSLPKLILTMTLSDGSIGYGEFYRGHDWNVIKSMSNHLLGKSIDGIPLKRIPISKSREYDGFECALWDAFAKSKNLRLVDLVGGALRDKIKVSAWSSHRTLEEIGHVAKEFKDMGYDTLKLKCDLSDPIVEICEEIKHCADGLNVILDSNERWQNVSCAKPLIYKLARVGNVLLIEDPIPHWMWHEYAELRRLSQIPIVLHVSIPYAQQGQSVSDAINALKHGSVDGFNFNAGINIFMQLNSIASAAGLNCWHGSEIDLGILEAMYVHTAAASESCVWPSDIFGRLLRKSDLLKDPIRIEPPYAYLPNGLGLGVDLDLHTVDKFKTSELDFCLK